MIRNSTPLIQDHLLNDKAASFSYWEIGLMLTRGDKLGFMFDDSPNCILLDTSLPEDQVYHGTRTEQRVVPSDAVPMFRGDEASKFYTPKSFPQKSKVVSIIDTDLYTILGQTYSRHLFWSPLPEDYFEVTKMQESGEIDAIIVKIENIFYLLNGRPWKF